MAWLFKGFHKVRLNYKMAFANPISGDVEVGFPAPDYDSGWQSISKGQTKTLTHSLGGDEDNYLVELTVKESYGGWGVFESLYYKAGEDYYKYGCHWRNLDDSIIKVYRGSRDNECDYIRVRIWITG